MNDYVSAWRCIGCGAIEAPQTCIGVCQHRKVSFVYADDHERAVGALRERNRSLEALLRRISATHPRDGRYEAAFRSFQDEARALLATDHAAEIALEVEPG